MNAPPPPPKTLSQQISEAAEQTEFQETCQLIGEWFTRKTRTFQGSIVQVEYEMNMDWYLVTVLYEVYTPKEGRKITIRAVEQIRAEDVVENATSPGRWTGYLNQVFRRMRTTLANGMRAFGVTLEENSGWYEATGQRARPQLEKEIVALSWPHRWPGVRMTWDYVPAPSKKEEEAAIESIKQAMRDQ